MRIWIPSVVLVLIFGAIIMLSGCGSNSPDAVFNRGLRAVSERDPIGASLYFEDFIKKFPEDERAFTAYNHLAQCYFAMSDFANARGVFEEMKENFDDPKIQMRCNFEIGGTYYREGFIDQAVKTFSDIAAATDEPRIQMQSYFALGSLYANLTQSATAQHYYDQIYTIASEKITDPTEAFGYKMQSLSSKSQVFE